MANPISKNLSALIFNTVHRTNLVYNTCWEDPRLDREAMQLKQDDNVFVITSAGCNALDYALDKPKHIYAIDVNSRQNALLELKIAGIRALDFETFFQLFGRGRVDNFKLIYKEKLRPILPAFAQKHWDRHLHYFEGKTFYFKGTSGMFCRVMKTYIDWNRLQESFVSLFDAADLQQQKEIYEKYIRDIFWSRLLKWSLKGDTVLSLLGIPRAQKELINRTYKTGIVGFMEDCFETVLTKLPIQDNYFWWLYLTGSYIESRCPEYLREENFNLLKADGLDRVTTHTTTAQAFLDKHDGQISRFVLLDHMDWLSHEKPKILQAEWQAIVDRASDNCRLLWRSGGSEVDFVDPIQVQLKNESVQVGELLKYNRPLAKELHQRDRVHTYGSFYIADMQAA